MPNHVTNILTISGDAELVIKIKSEISSIDEDGDLHAIDFNKIVPAPGSLNITAGSATNNGIAIINYRNGDLTAMDGIMENTSWKFNSPEELIDHLLDKDLADLEDGQTALDNFKKYGHIDWYSWNNDNWGTKWNAYEIDIRENGDIKFETAWSNPYQVMEALSLKYPEAIISVRYADEDFGHNVGEYTLTEGSVIEENTPNGGSEEAYELAADITGYDTYLVDRLYDIEADTVDELEAYEIENIRIIYNKGIVQEFPKVVLEVMEQMAVKDENYEFAEKIKNTISVNEE